MDQPAQLHFDLLELSWWQYPHVWVCVGIILLLLLSGSAYWWWMRGQQLRRPQTPLEKLRRQLAQLAAAYDTSVPNSYEEQRMLYVELSHILHVYAHLCLQAPDIALTDAELSTFCKMFEPRTEVAELVSSVLEHGQQIKFAGQMLDSETVRCEVAALIGAIQKELDAHVC